MERRIEEILQADDLDKVTESFGSFEKSLAIFVFAVSSLPLVATSVVFKFSPKHLSRTLIASVLLTLVIFFVIQFRFHDVVRFSNNFQEWFSNARVRI